MSARKSLHKWSRGSRKEETILKQLDSGKLSIKQFEYEYRLELNKLRRRLQNLEKSDVYELAMTTAQINNPISVYTLSNVKNFTNEERAAALSEVAYWADNPYLSVKEYDTKNPYKMGKRGLYYISQKEALNEMALPEFDYIFNELGYSGYNKTADFLKSSVISENESLKVAIINARYAINRRYKEKGKYCKVHFSDPVSLLSRGYDALSVEEVGILKTAQKAMREEFTEEIRNQLKLIEGRKNFAKSKTWGRGLSDLIKRANVYA